MPYIENEEEKQRREKWQEEKRARESKQDAAFNKLTRKQKDVLRDFWKAYDKWDTQTSEEWLLYDTYIGLKNVRGDFVRAFPALIKTNDEDE